MTGDSAAARILIRGLNVQSSVLFALVFKDYKIRLGKSRLGLLWVILEPIGHVVALSLIWVVMRQTEIMGVPIGLFIAMGVLFYLVFQRGLNTIPQALNASRSLLDYPQVKPFDCFFARFVLELGLLSASAIFLFSVLLWMGDFAPPVPAPLEFCLLLAVAWIIALGLGLIVGTYATIFPSIGRIVTIASRPLIFVSAVFYPASQIPTELRGILSWNPVLQAIELARSFVYGIAPFPELDFGYLAMWAVTTLSLGMVVVYANRYRLVQR